MCIVVAVNQTRDKSEEANSGSESKAIMKMNRPTRKMGLAVLAGGLAFVGVADAKDVVVDGSFENATPNSGLPIVSEGGFMNFPQIGQRLGNT